MSNLVSLRFRVNAATERRKHTQVDLCGFRGVFEQSLRFLINSARLDTSVFTSMLTATKRKSRTKERNTKKDESYLPPCNVFGGISRSFGAVGVVLVAPRTGRCATVAYESRARWRSPRQHNQNNVTDCDNVLVSST